VLDERNLLGRRDLVLLCVWLIISQSCFSDLLKVQCEGSQTSKRWMDELRCVKKMSAALIAENKTLHIWQQYAPNVSDVFPTAIPAYKNIHAGCRVLVFPLEKSHQLTTKNPILHNICFMLLFLFRDREVSFCHS